MIGLTPQQVIDRRNWLGASDVAAVVGCNEYSGAMEVWHEKKGLRIRDEPGEPAEWGHRLEVPIAAKYCEVAGLDPWDLKPGKTVAHPTAPWARATPDRVAADRLVQIKTAGHNAAKGWGATWGLDVPAEPTAIPLSYYVQIQWEMLVSEVWRNDVAVLLAGQKFRVYRYEFQAAFAQAVFELAGQFWEEYVEADVEPAKGVEAVPRRELEKRFPAVFLF